jgi:hypothetical protein
MTALLVMNMSPQLLTDQKKMRIGFLMLFVKINPIGAKDD